MSALGHWAPALYTVLLWWFTTGFILWLDRLGPARRRWSVVGAAVLAFACAAALYALRDGRTALDAYVSFTAATLIWGFVELTFLTGYVTGPRRAPCPSGAHGWPRLRAALGVLLYHEVALLAAGATILLLTGAGSIGFQAFAALWLMRQSAKLNLYFGVRNPGEQFLPDQLAYLASYFRHRPMNLLFPWSILALSLAAAWLILQLASLAPIEPRATSLALLAALVVLGLLEHWFLVLPIRVEALWQWSLKPRQRPRAQLRVDPMRAMPAPTRGAS